MCGGGSSTSTNQSLADPRVSANYDLISNRARNVSDIPFEYYPGNLVAPISGQMQSGFDIVNQSQGVAAPFISQAAQYAQQGAGPISADAIQRYSNPYQQSVVDATMANINEMNGRQQQDVIGNAISKGAWGGDRAGVAQAELARQQGLAAGQTLAGLNAQNYQQALAAAQQDAQRQGQAAYTMGALGQEAQSTALTGANAQIASGQLQQQQAQNEINATYGQYQQARQYPFNTTQWLAGILGGQAGTMGGTSSTSTPSPGIAQQAIGAGAGIAGILGATGAFGSSGWLWSDERLKENIEPIGRAFDGQMIYRYNFKGDPATQIGFLAQEVERHHPGAVAQTIDGIKGVDYRDATDDAAERGGFGSGGIVNMSAPLIPSIDSYTPDIDSGATGPLVPAGYELKSITKPAYEQATRGGFADGGMPYGDATPYPDLGMVNGLPVPAAALPSANALRSPMTQGRGRGLPSAPRLGGGTSDIGSDVIRLASMLRSFGLGKGGARPAAVGNDAGGYGSVGDLIGSLGLQRGGRAPRANGGETEDEDRWSAPVTVRMPPLPAPVVTMAMPKPIPLPDADGRFPGIVIPERSQGDAAHQGVVPITTALESLRDETQSAPTGVVPAPAPVVLAAAPPQGRAFPSDYAGRIARVEGVTQDATNPHTGAAGYYQFMPATAYSLAQSTAWGRGMAPAQIMAAIKADPAKQDELLSLYNQHSTAALTRAGIPASDATMFALHAFGPAGGVSLLRADPNMPVADWVRSVRWDNGATPEQVIAQNGLGKYRTVGDLRRGFIEDRIGGPSPQGVRVAGAGVVPPDDGGDGGGAGVQGAGVAAAPPGGGLVPDDGGDETPKPKPKPGDSADDFMQSPWMALAQAGFGMAASRNSTLLGALGEGGMQGVKTAMEQGRLKKELQQAKAMEEHRKAMLGISTVQAERQARLAEETLRRNAAAEDARNRQFAQQEARMTEAQRQHAQTEKDRLRVIEENERHRRETESLARAKLDKPVMTKDTDPYTGEPIWANGHGDLFLKSDGKLTPYSGVQSGAQARGYQHDPAKERTIPLASGDAVIPPLDPRDLQLDRETLKLASRRADEIRKVGGGAGDVQRQLNELKKAFDNLPTSGPMSPGALADTWRTVARSANALTDTLGVAPMFNPDKVGSLDEMKKLTIQLAATATKAFNGSRPTNFDFEQMLQGTPGAQMGPEAFKRVVAFMESQNNRARDLAKYTTEYQRHRRTAYGVDDAFNAQRPDDFYTKQAGIVAPQRGGTGAPAPSGAAPPRVATEAEYNAVPRGSTYIDARDGKTKTKR